MLGRKALVKGTLGQIQRQSEEQTEDRVSVIQVKTLKLEYHPEMFKNIRCLSFVRVVEKDMDRDQLRLMLPLQASVLRTGCAGLHQNSAGGAAGKTGRRPQNR